MCAFFVFFFLTFILFLAVNEEDKEIKGGQDCSKVEGRFSVDVREKAG